MQKRVSASRDQAFAMACIYGVLRRYYSLSEELDGYLQKPLRKKDNDLFCLLLSALFQIRYMNVRDHAAVNENVSACKGLGKTWARGLINAVLRKAIVSDPPAGTGNDEIHFEHPDWLIKALRQDWPDDWAQILRANNQQAPLTLRINRRKTSRAEYLEGNQEAIGGVRSTLHAEAGIRLDDACPVEEIPGFKDGLVSVQDEAAQLAVTLLGLKGAQRILDACAAPGGKTSHILETCSDDSELWAVDVSASRLEDLHHNLTRLNLSAHVCTGDASLPGQWWDELPFDRILVDAPCTGTGVIRRHPDIRFHRAPEQIAAMHEQQCAILSALWPLLRNGGTLLYVTCSILRAENDATIDHVMKSLPGIKIDSIDTSWGRETLYGRQILPGEDDMDGFFFCRLKKSVSDE